MQTAQEIYTSAIRELPANERLRLAALILNDLAQPTLDAPEYDDSWSEEDISDFRNATLRYMEAVYLQDEDVV